MLAETQETPASTSSAAGLAVAARCQAPPVKRSAIAAWFTPVGGIVPTAVQLLADTQETPFRAAPAGPGVACTVHVLPSQCSASTGPMLGVPTAVQLARAVQETALSWPSVAVGPRMDSIRQLPE